MVNYIRVEVGCPVTNLTKLIYYEVNLKVEFANFNLRLRDLRNSRKQGAGSCLTRV